MHQSSCYGLGAILKGPSELVRAEVLLLLKSLQSLMTDDSIQCNSGAKTDIVLKAKVLNSWFHLI